MTASPSTRTGAHRARPSPLRAAAPGLALVLALLVGGLAWLFWPEDQVSTVGTQGAGSESSSPDPDGEGTAPATPTPSPTPSGAEPQTSPASPTASPDTGETEPSGTINVVVLNASGVAGLARDVADTLDAAGWGVTSVGNLEAPDGGSTVYYPEGFAAEAQVLARAVPGEQAVAPVTPEFATDHLTLVLAEDIR